VSLATYGARLEKLLLTCDAVGGVWTYTCDLTGVLTKSGIAVHVSVLGPAPTAAQRSMLRQAGTESIDCPGLPLDWTASNPENLDATADNLQARALAIDADLAHLSAPALAGVRKWPMPLVVSAHSCIGTWWAAMGDGVLPLDLAWRVERTALGLAVADAVVAPSESFRSALQSVYGARAAVCVHNGCEASAGPVVKRDGSVILTSGRLWDRGKNAGVIDQAAARMRQSVFAAGPVMGPNGESARFRNLVLLGNLDRDAMGDWYRRATIFVSTSKYEPFGLAVLEAAQFGAALVLADIPTFRELWDGAAMFVDPDDPQQVAETLDALANDARRRLQLAAAARSRASEYSAARMGSGTLAVYRRVLGTRRGAQAVEEATA
jgi:glycogen synthase